MKAEIRLEKGNTDVVVDGNKMIFVKCVNVHGSADGNHTLTLDMFLHDFALTVDGQIIINAFPVTDKVGRAIYESLKQRYEIDLT